MHIEFFKIEYCGLFVIVIALIDQVEEVEVKDGEEFEDGVERGDFGFEHEGEEYDLVGKNKLDSSHFVNQWNHYKEKHDDVR